MVVINGPEYNEVNMREAKTAIESKPLKQAVNRGEQVIVRPSRGQLDKTDLSRVIDVHCIKPSLKSSNPKPRASVLLFNNGIKNILSVAAKRCCAPKIIPR